MRQVAPLHHWTHVYEKILVAVSLPLQTLAQRSRRAMVRAGVFLIISLSLALSVQLFVTNTDPAKYSIITVENITAYSTFIK